MKKIAVVTLMVLLLTLLVVGATYALTNDINLAQIASRYSVVGLNALPDTASRFAFVGI